MGYIRLDGSGLGNATEVKDTLTGRSCRAVENRIKANREAPAAELVQIDVAHSYYPARKVRLTRNTYDAYRRMKAAAQADGLDATLLKVVSGFRSVAEQTALWNKGLARRKGEFPPGTPISTVEKENVKWVARPGSSPHHTGRAVDLWLGVGISSKRIKQLRATKAYNWMVCNAGRFGFSPYAREPWHWEYNPADGDEVMSSAPALPQTGGPGTAPGAPPLVDRQSSAIGETLYLKIPLGSESPAKALTGVFMPTGFRAGAAVDVILYLHGYKLYGHSPTESISSTWNAQKHPAFAFREELAKARRNVVLIAPTLGPKSETGRLTKAGGFDTYFEQVLAALAAYGPFAGIRPTLGNVIIAAHSGGGFPMRRLALGNDYAAKQVRECWAFDSMYNTGDETLWATWARKRPDNRFFVYYQKSTSARSEALAKQGVPNVTVVRSPAKSHNHVPIHHWSARIQDTPFLTVI